ncbi:Metaxin-2 [Mortierella claussenii]|nr:Metaxin-2 [Mortierella claussenii]
MTDTEKQVISTNEGEPIVEYIEEVQPDGSILRKKKTTRKITKRVLTTTSSSSIVPTSNENGQENTSTTTSTSSHLSTSKASSSQEDEFKDTKDGHAAQEKTGVKEGRNSTSEENETESKRAFKYRFFGAGDTKDHPFYRFLAAFPLKQSPAPHTRKTPVKAIMYAYAPGWKVTQEATNDALSPVGSFDSYLKFNKIEYEIKPAFEPSMSPSGKLPFLALPNGKYVTSDGFEAWVQENKPASVSAKLDHHEAAEAVAFIALAESKIHAALLYTLWFEPSHFHATTRQHYFGHYNRLLATLLSYLEKSNIAHTMLLTRTQIDRELIFEEAAAAVEALAVQLGNDNEYFFGKSEPSSLDAIIFSYLHVILTLPRIRNAEDGGRSGELTRIVRKHENLYKYSQNIWRKWFAL